MEITRHENSHRRHLGVKSDLASQGDGCPELLPGVRIADIRLEDYAVVRTTLDEIGASQAMFHDRRASPIDISFGSTNPLILHANLSQKTRINISLEVLGVHVNVANKLTTLKEWIH
jgi:hypothetical protein